MTRTRPRARTPAAVFAATTAAATLACLVAFAGASGATSGCASYDPDARVTLAVPPRAGFDAVEGYLDHRCGSLDCHGSAARNLIIYGCEGLRLSPDATPGCRASGGTNTTTDETDRTFLSVVGLEPVLLGEIVATHGDPDQLTLVRKPRGEESHKGGRLVAPGDDGDRCVTSWVGGQTDVDACANGAAITP